MPTWTNNGLTKTFGPDRALPQKGGEYRTLGQDRQIEFRIDLTTLTEAETPLANTVFFPKGMKIKSVEIYVETAAATGVAIDIGLVRTDRTTEIDFDGIVAAAATATLTAGAKLDLVKGSTGVGAYITNGTTLANVGYVTASRTTATAFTAGVIKVVIRYERP